jgi:hypothetical protein
MVASRFGYRENAELPLLFAKLAPAAEVRPHAADLSSEIKIIKGL